ncbi:MAG: DUF2461 domain-containing protein [Candidatus Kariarchaeaceae archaeon]
MISNEFTNFFRNLENNNSKAWFDENRKIYETKIRDPFKEFINILIFKIQEYDTGLLTDSKTAIFRINRDVRFSKDKTLYKTHVSAHMNTGKRADKNSPGYYVQLSKDTLSIGGGLYFVDKTGKELVRSAISKDLSAFHNLVNEKNLKKHFGEIQGDKNKRIPKELAKFAEKQPLLMNSNWYIMTDLVLDQVRKDILEVVDKHFRIISPLVKFLRTALG